jgi:nicotinamidase/pyrazinamidase
MSRAITISDQDVLLAVDLQADFMPGGALAVEDGDTIVPLVNALARRFANVVVTQDWHPAGHASFASVYDDAQPFETNRLDYGD